MSDDGHDGVRLALSESSSPYIAMHSLDVPDRSNAWRRHLSDVMDLSPALEPCDDLSDGAERFAFGGLFLVRMAGGDLPPMVLPPVSGGFCRLVLLRSGGRRRSRAGRARTSGFLSLGPSPLREGDFIEKRGRTCEWLVLSLPREALRLDCQDNLRGDRVALSPALGDVLGDYLAGLARRLDGMTATEADALAAPTAALVAASLATSIVRLDVPDAPLASVMIERARQLVRQNMAGPGFGPDQLCRLFGVSRSKLYRFFEKTGGVASFIQRERLQEAFARLGDLDEMRSINAIANDVGFVDHSTFSRAFRREFGVSPSEAREMALVQRAGGAVRQPAETIARAS